MAEMQAALFEINEVDIRVVQPDQIKDYAVLNPALMIIENIEAARDALSLSNPVYRTVQT